MIFPWHILYKHMQAVYSSYQNSIPHWLPHFAFHLKCRSINQLSRLQSQYTLACMSLKYRLLEVEKLWNTPSSVGARICRIACTSLTPATPVIERNYRALNCIAAVCSNNFLPGCPLCFLTTVKIVKASSSAFAVGVLCEILQRLQV